MSQQQRNLSTNGRVVASSLDANPRPIDDATDERVREGRLADPTDVADLLAAIYANGTGSKEKALFDTYWREARSVWLQELPSKHTRRAYEVSVEEFEGYLHQHHTVGHLWRVETRHVVGWIDHMRHVGSSLRADPEPLSDRTINLRLAALSSLYEYMSRATRLHRGIDIELFVRADGRPRENPFRSTRVKRPKVATYGSANPVPQPIMQWILNRLAKLHPKAISHYRDYALLMTFCYTGYRTETVLSMRWGDFQVRGDGVGVVHCWIGRFDKEVRKPFPHRVWSAILAYLQADGRYRPDQAPPDDEMFIWHGLRRHGNRNLAVQRLLAAGHEHEEAVVLAKQELEAQDGNKHIAHSTANEVLRRHLRHYYAHELRRDGMRKSEARALARRLATAYQLHSLRDTFANALDQATNGDIHLIADMLDHQNINTTRAYLESIRDPEDKVSALLEQAYGF